MHVGVLYRLCVCVCVYVCVLLSLVLLTNLYDIVQQCIGEGYGVMPCLNQFTQFQFASISTFRMHVRTSV
jgi:hypothetical protein